MRRKPRKYQQAWLQLKKNSQLRLQVPPAFVARVRKAIIKEKHLDLGFKIANEEDTFFLETHYDPAKQVLSFTLKQRLGLEEKVIA